MLKTYVAAADMFEFLKVEAAVYPRTVHAQCDLGPILLFNYQFLPRSTDEAASFAYEIACDFRAMESHDPCGREALIEPNPRAAPSKQSAWAYPWAFSRFWNFPLLQRK